MPARENKKLVSQKRDDKPIEKRGFPPVPPRPAIDDLHFVLSASLLLGKKIILEIDKALRIMKD
jgi:hypothetical protein